MTAFTNVFVWRGNWTLSNVLYHCNNVLDHFRSYLIFWILVYNTMFLALDIKSYFTCDEFSFQGLTRFIYFSSFAPTIKLHIILSKIPHNFTCFKYQMKGRWIFSTFLIFESELTLISFCWYILSWYFLLKNWVYTFLNIFLMMLWTDVATRCVL